jgi:hypothetical protein
MNIKLIKYIFLAFVILFFTSKVLSAQPGDQQDKKLKEEFEKLKTDIQSARDLITAYPNSEAEKELEMIIEEANELEIKWPELSIKVKRTKINDLKKRLKSITRLILKDRVSNIEANIDELIKLAENIVSESKNEKAFKLLADAKDYREKARDAFKNGAGRNSVNFYDKAKFFANRAIELAKKESNDLKEKVRLEQERLDKLISEAKNLIGDDTNSKEYALLNDAIKLRGDGIKAYNEGKYEVALRNYSMAEKLLVRASSFVSDKVKPEAKAESNVQNMRELLESMREQVDVSKNSQAIELFRKANEFANSAESAFVLKNYDEAERNAEIASNLAAKSIHLIKSTKTIVNKEQIQQELKNVEKLINDLESDISGQNKETKIFINISQVYYKKAKVYLEQNKLHNSSETIFIATKLLTKANELSKISFSIDTRLVQENISRIEQIIDKVRKKIFQSGSERAIEQFEKSIELKEKSKESLVQGNISLSYELSELSLDFLLKAVKSSEK